MRCIAQPVALPSVCVLLLAAVLLVGGQASGQTLVTAPALVFTTQTVQVQGMTPGGTVIWFGLSKVIEEYAPTLAQRQEVDVADAQGTSTLTVTPSVPRQSIWVAVDLKTGAYVLAGPPASPPRQFNLAGLGLSLGGGAAGDQLADRSDLIEVLLVRPGVGAWVKTVGRGGDGDVSSPTDPALQLTLGSLDSLAPAGSAAPQTAIAGDLLFVAHPRTMEIAAQVIGGHS